MQLSSLFGHSAELYRIIKKSHQPPDKLTKEYLKRKKYLGSNDRKFISEIIFTILRLKSLPEYCLSSALDRYSVDNINIEQNKQSTLSDFLIIVSGIIAAELMGITLHSVNKLINKDNDFTGLTCKALIQRFDIDEKSLCTLLRSIYKQLEHIINAIEKLEIRTGLNQNEMTFIAARYAQQEWVISSLIDSSKYSSGELKSLFESFLYPAPLTLRINAAPEQRDAILSECREFDSAAEKTKFSPFGIILSKRVDLNTLALYKNGIIEVQDEGSQLISIALNPVEEDKILDACAGAGGKSLHIASLVNNNALIIASDVELRKLKELNKRCTRTGIRSVTTFLSKNIAKSGIKNFNRVLVDAPCSGMGTIRRNPMLKWKLTPALLEKYNRKQMKILNDYAEYVAPGGTLLYSTCSIMPQENDKITAQFLDKHKEFSPSPLKPAFDTFDISLPGLGENDFQYQLLPSMHNCDGFYFAKFIRKF